MKTPPGQTKVQKKSYICSVRLFRYRKNETEKHILSKHYFSTAAAQQGNAINVYNHLKQHHKIQYDEITQSQENNIKVYDHKNI